MKGRLASIDTARTNQMLEASLAHGAYTLPPELILYVHGENSKQDQYRFGSPLAR